MSQDAPLLELTNVYKSFPGVAALKDVSFTVMAGHVHALLGENGAGKSTLVKIISGVYRPDAGEMRIHGQPVTIASPWEARALGIVGLQ